MKRKIDDEIEEPSLVEFDDNAESEEEEKVTSKKRKRKGKAMVSGKILGRSFVFFNHEWRDWTWCKFGVDLFVMTLDAVEGFTVFKSSKKLEAVIEPNEEAEDGVSQQKKKLNKQIEVITMSIIVVVTTLWLLWYLASNLLFLFLSAAR